LPLRFGEDDIDEIFRGWDRRDLFEVVLHDDDALRGNSKSDKRLAFLFDQTGALLSARCEAAVKKNLSAAGIARLMFRVYYKP